MRHAAGPRVTGSVCRTRGVGEQWETSGSWTRRSSSFSPRAKSRTSTTRSREAIRPAGARRVRRRSAGSRGRRVLQRRERSRGLEHLTTAAQDHLRHGPRGRDLPCARHATARRRQLPFRPARGARRRPVQRSCWAGSPSRPAPPSSACSASTGVYVVGFAWDDLHYGSAHDRPAKTGASRSRARRDRDACPPGDDRDPPVAAPRRSCRSGSAELNVFFTESLDLLCIADMTGTSAAEPALGGDAGLHCARS